MLGIAGHYIESHFVSYQHCLFGPEPSNVCLHITFFCDQQSNSCCICWTSRAHFVSYHQCLLEGEPADGGFHGVITLAARQMLRTNVKSLSGQSILSLLHQTFTGGKYCVLGICMEILGVWGVVGGGLIQYWSNIKRSCQTWFAAWQPHRILLFHINPAAFLSFNFLSPHSQLSLINPRFLEIDNCMLSKNNQKATITVINHFCLFLHDKNIEAAVFLKTSHTNCTVKDWKTSHHIEKWTLSSPTFVLFFWKYLCAKV